MSKHLIEPNDLSNEEILKLIEVGKEIQVNPKKYNQLCSGKILASLFFEPSTRTKFSFDAPIESSFMSSANIFKTASLKTFAFIDTSSGYVSVKFTKLFTDVDAFWNPPYISSTSVSLIYATGSPGSYVRPFNVNCE